MGTYNDPAGTFSYRGGFQDGKANGFGAFVSVTRNTEYKGFFVNNKFV